ncbi:hypothetical protein C8N39_10923 [Dietzia psychralcaliphila]|nr:hypothetical protein C8N39_10923 [Dietzia psychralcaliphila]
MHNWSMSSSPSFSLAAPPLQVSVDRFVSMLRMPKDLLDIHPRKKGNSGKWAAVNPALVLGVISAFEGFVEDFVAVGLSKQGATMGEIAAEIGKWNNPDLREFSSRVETVFGGAGKIVGGRDIRLNVNTKTGHSTWAERDVAWDQVVLDASAWMQVRHALTHGLVPSWSDVRWPPPLRKTVSRPAASSVLRESGNGHTLVLQNALNCCRIYTLGAQHIADSSATWLGESLDWSKLPEFK